MIDSDGVDAGDEEPTHEDTIQAALVTAFDPRTADLAESSEAAGKAPLRDDGGAVVTVSAARTYRDAMVLTWDRGIVLELSDGSQFQITIVRSANPRT